MLLQNCLKQTILKLKDCTTIRKMSKLCANLSFMFQEGATMPERYALAKAAGFNYVESGFPLGFTIDEITGAKNKSGLQQPLINLFTGDTSNGEVGVTFKPGCESTFRDHLELTIYYAKSLKCSYIHVMAGKLDEVANDDHWKTFESNLLHAARKLEKENIIGLIEPINPYSVPNYFLNDYEKAIEIIKRINSPHMRLMLDIFHLQQIKGDLSHSIEKYLPYTGYVQIAQVPNRGQPSSPGEINYKYLLNFLKEVGYTGYIGLEYKPIGPSDQSLDWVKQYGLAL